MSRRFATTTGVSAVGYGKPPVHSRFRKGVSGNPGGRPRGTTTARGIKLLLKEAYRTVLVKEGGRVLALPAIQVLMRGQIALAAKGNGPAQRAVIQQVYAIEQEQANKTAEGNSAQRGPDP